MYNKNKELDASVIVRQVSNERTGFWTRGKVTQSELAEYLTESFKLGTKLLLDYKIGKIDPNSWMNKFHELWLLTVIGSNKPKELLEKEKY